MINEKSHFKKSQLIKFVNQAVNAVSLLQKILDHQSPEATQTIAVALIRQKKILSQLRKLANNGSAIAGIGYVKACCISGQNVDYIFNYRDHYAHSPETVYLKKLFEPTYLLPFLLKNNVLNKVNSIASFTLDLPDLSQKPFSTHLYDALHIKNQAGKTFGEELSEKLHSLHTEADGDLMAQAFIEKVIRLTAQKGYAPVQNLYARLLAADQKNTDSKEVYQSVLRNKFSRGADKTLAQSQLKRQNTLPYQRESHFLAG